LVLVDLEGRIFHMNRQAEILLGQPGPRAAGTLLRARLRHPALAAFWASAAQESGPATSEVRLSPGKPDPCDRFSVLVRLRRADRQGASPP
ncbi:MAG: hypothetical protein ACRD1P_08660, partial [Thermoanaerobaculia bacterium]